MISNSQLQVLSSQLEGELHFDELMRVLYATDASVYRMLPLAVAFPKTIADIKVLISFANQNNTSLIPRTAGTSLAGQCVGKGIVVDVSKYFTKIINVNEIDQTVTVQPGVIRDELNNYLKPFGFFFGPNTSTSNRCMIGGMVGNNSSGTTSIRYGVTRDKVVALKTILSDGSEVFFSDVSKDTFKMKSSLDSLEGRIYSKLFDELASDEVQQQIKEQFPKAEIHRRNTGYAIDELLDTQLFSNTNTPINLCKLLAGSEGTLAFTTQIILKLDKLPPSESIIIAVHFESINNGLKAVEPLMAHELFACEMIDKTILDLTRHNKTQEQNRQFIVGDPQAILLCEVRANSTEMVDQKAKAVVKTLQHINLSYANPLLSGLEIEKANELRKAGLGLLGNMIGDKKTAACIEDTAVAISDLANYIEDFTRLMDGYKQKAVYYAHAGAGELHLRPILNLKKKEDVVLFRKITTDVARLVKSYNGSMSGEHGDGIVRAEFIPLMIGNSNYEILKRIKSVFDPNNIFNPGKIVAPYVMDESLRYEVDRKEPTIPTILDFSNTQGILREAEKCNGSGDCRKLSQFGGTMCPSYRATKNEKDTTRARANALREFLTHSEKQNKFDHHELKEVFDLCLSCKACASECPSSVDVASLKAEFLYQFQEVNGYRFKDRFFANSTKYNKISANFPKISNSIFTNSWSSKLMKHILGIHPNRSLPIITKPFSSLKAQIKSDDGYIKKVFLFIDEFINYLESSIALDAKLLLENLGYKVLTISHIESGRSYISKGFLKQAKAIANSNINYFKETANEEDFCLVGIEPSAILTFKDEYLKLADDKITAKRIADQTFMIETFIQQEIELGNITSEQFTSDHKIVKFHGHCHQKAFSNQMSSFSVLNLPKNYKVSIIPSGCCGMAGSFGYEKEHYDVSMLIGEQTLFPAIRKTSQDVIIAANGTSCRHQIKDGTKREAYHPISILLKALA
ncbi:FAD-binding and (Fe-S)-binding domain-containing protein [uncultured Psychroserpens sp.]|uniref:FAD-binding and (Fe-S)-binding domain-containing protein n=1 Tax=uncultured Psychroserpens sp. TaxID=255436 RepID=UPI00260A6B2D|nr:FAD-binding and (Fe-S)-binding domain-containing protein [uncultured Psychroserpens sp.]